jgi:modification methylase
VLAIPAPFPLNLPHRCIQVYTFKGDTVLDPFCGVGTTCLAVAKLGRSYIGYDTDKEYIDTASKRIERSLTRDKPISVFRGSVTGKSS